MAKQLKWTEKDKKEALKQGWVLADVDQKIIAADGKTFQVIYEIQRADEARVFQSDREACIHVCQQAFEGNKLAQKALLLHQSAVK